VPHSLQLRSVCSTWFSTRAWRCSSPSWWQVSSRRSTIGHRLRKDFTVSSRPTPVSILSAYSAIATILYASLTAIQACHRGRCSGNFRSDLIETRYRLIDWLIDWSIISTITAIWTVGHTLRSTPTNWHRFTALRFLWRSPIQVLTGLDVT